MNVIDTDIPDVKIIEPKVFEDARGFFYEAYNKRDFDKAIGRKVDFVQDNHSRSAKGTLRGLHYQQEHSQGKLVRCSVGAIYDVAVDIRKGSPTYGKWIAAELNSENKRMLWIPEGFAHAFLVISDVAEVLYKATDFYDPASERSIRWDDADLGIAWPLDGEPLLSEKDAKALCFRNLGDW